MDFEKQKQSEEMFLTLLNDVLQIIHDGYGEEYVYSIREKFFVFSSCPECSDDESDENLEKELDEKVEKLVELMKLLFELNKKPGE